jgi:hypothetical protein
MVNDGSLPPEPLPLTAASVQEIQLELIRRRQFNEFNGKRIVQSLRRRRDLWQAVVLDRKDSLIALRDLPMNYWNVDTLFVLCEDIGKATRITELAEEDDWKADTVHIDQNETELAKSLGTSDPGIVVEFWWD